MSDAVEITTSEDDWFARKGLEAILTHIEKVERGRQRNEQREYLRELMKRVAARVMAKGGPDGWGPGIRLDRWASVGQEALYTPSVGVTAFIALSYNEDDKEPYRLHDVVDGDRVRTHLSVSFNPSTKHGRVGGMTVWARTRW